VIDQDFTSGANILDTQPPRSDNIDEQVPALTPTIEDDQGVGFSFVNRTPKSTAEPPVEFYNTSVKEAISLYNSDVGEQDAIVSESPIQAQECAPEPVSKQEDDTILHEHSASAGLSPYLEKIFKEEGVFNNISPSSQLEIAEPASSAHEEIRRNQEDNIPVDLISSTKISPLGALVIVAPRQVYNSVETYIAPVPVETEVTLVPAESDEEAFQSKGESEVHPLATRQTRRNTISQLPEPTISSRKRRFSTGAQAGKLDDHIELAFDPITNARRAKNHDPTQRRDLNGKIIPTPAAAPHRTRRFSIKTMKEDIEVPITEPQAKWDALQPKIPASLRPSHSRVANNNYISSASENLQYTTSSRFLRQPVSIVASRDDDAAKQSSLKLQAQRIPITLNIDSNWKGGAAADASSSNTSHLASTLSFGPTALPKLFEESTGSAVRETLTEIPAISEDIPALSPEINDSGSEYMSAQDFNGFDEASDEEMFDYTANIPRGTTQPADSHVFRDLRGEGLRKTFQQSVQDAPLKMTSAMVNVETPLRELNLYSTVKSPRENPVGSTSSYISPYHPIHNDPTSYRNNGNIDNKAIDLEVAPDHRDEAAPISTPKLQYNQHDSSPNSTGSLAHASNYDNMKKGSQIKKTTIKSPYFAPLTPSKSQRKTPESASKSTLDNLRTPGGNLSCIPFPRLDAPCFGILQEKLAHDPLWLLIAVTFLIKTHGKLAIPAFHKLMNKYPNPEDLASAEKEYIVSIFKKIGLQNNRARTVQLYARTWLFNPPQKGKRYAVRGYPTRLSGRDIKKDEVLDDNDSREAWEIGHMTQGHYALDSWRIFCRDSLRGVERNFQPEWMRVLPEDKELRAYLRWKWLREEGKVWDPVTGDTDFASEELLEAAREGRIVWDDKGGMSIVPVVNSWNPVPDNVGLEVSKSGMKYPSSNGITDVAVVADRQSQTLAEILMTESPSGPRLSRIPLEKSYQDMDTDIDEQAPLASFSNELSQNSKIPQQRACSVCREKKRRCGREAPFCAHCVNRNCTDKCSYSPPPRQTPTSRSQRVACFNCHAKKRRCNRGTPFCAECVKRNCTATCIYPSAIVATASSHTPSTEIEIKLGPLNDEELWPEKMEIFPSPQDLERIEHVVPASKIVDAGLNSKAVLAEDTQGPYVEYEAVGTRVNSVSAESTDSVSRMPPGEDTQAELKLVRLSDGSHYLARKGYLAIY
jgi:methyl-CpG-binding domain protein 4